MAKFLVDFKLYGQIEIEADSKEMVYDKFIEIQLEKLKSKITELEDAYTNIVSIYDEEELGYSKKE